MTIVVVGAACLLLYLLNVNDISNTKRAGRPRGVNSFVRSASCGRRHQGTAQDLRCAPSKSSFIYVGNGGHFAHTLCNDRATFQLRADSQPMFTTCAGRGPGRVYFGLRASKNAMTLSSARRYRSHCATKHHDCDLSSPTFKNKDLSVAA